MKSLFVALACLALAVPALAEDGFKSGPQVGDSIGPYDSVKCNASSDGIAKQGDKLCYT